MPSLPDYANVLKVRFLFTVGGDANVATTWHFKYTGTAPTDATCSAIATTIAAAAVTRLGASLNVNNTFQGASVQDLTSGSAGFGEHLAAVDGSRSGEPVPAATCVLLHQPIARRYRGGKSRTYWPLLGASDLTNPSAWDGSVIATTQAELIDLQSDIQSIVDAGCTIGEQVSISYYSGFTAVTNPITGRTRDVPNVRSAAIAPDAILSLACSGAPATQRRRAQQT
jgi:hypothetical protein